MKTHYSAITFKHVLLPVYLAAYRFNDKVYQVMVNARTGEVIGDRPYSYWKIGLLLAVVILMISAAASMGHSDQAGAIGLIGLGLIAPLFFDPKRIAVLRGRRKID